MLEGIAAVCQRGTQQQPQGDVRERRLKGHLPLNWLVLGVVGVCAIC